MSLKSVSVFGVALAALLGPACSSDDGGGGGSDAGSLDGAGGSGGSSGASGGGNTSGDSGVNLDQLGTACVSGACPAGLTPVSYCGIAGCSGGMFCSCEIPCDKDPNACPPGASCVSISDGPGQVCAKN